MNQSRDYQQNREVRNYRAPDIEMVDGCTYNRWGALAVVYGLNVPFVSRLANSVVEEEGFHLWSAPRLVLTIAEAHDAYKSRNETRQKELMLAAIDYCNQYLPQDSRMSDDTILRLTWVQFGICSISCEHNRRNDYEMDVVRHGVNTLILNAPKDDNAETERRMQTALVMTPTGTPFERPQREERNGDSRSPLNPNRRDGGRLPFKSRGGGQRGAMGY